MPDRAMTRTVLFPQKTSIQSKNRPIGASRHRKYLSRSLRCKTAKPSISAGIANENNGRTNGKGLLFWADKDSAEYDLQKRALYLDTVREWRFAAILPPNMTVTERCVKHSATMVFCVSTTHV